MNFDRNNTRTYTVGQLRFTLRLLAVAVASVYLGLALVLTKGVPAQASVPFLLVSLLAFYVMLGVQIYRLEGSVGLWIAAVFFTSPVGQAVAFWLARKQTAELCAVLIGVEDAPEMRRKA